MSSLIGGNTLAPYLHRENVQSIAPNFYQMEREIVAKRQDNDYSSLWWPGSGFIGDRGIDVAVMDSAIKWWDYPEITKGANSRYGIAGVTRDAYGSAIVSCLVKLFKTSNDSLVSQIVSDANNGSYLLSTPYYPDTHYIVAFKSGSPDVAGTTLNTLVGS
jgi:hypothetical protein